ncbi:MAG TPA: hypothetical protein DDY31_11685 [Lachnospiraceae bacterium]|nr:hypothetical protein [Lachnospiraceae bacterium]
MRAGMTLLLGTGAGMAVMGAISRKTVNEKKEKIDKFKTYYNILNQWMIIKQEGKTIEEYFHINNIKTIAIYGMGEMGYRLYDDLKAGDIEVKYAIDKNVENIYGKLDIFDVDDNLPSVDAIVVTAVFAFDEIKEKLESVTDYDVVSLQDVIYEI